METLLQDLKHAFRLLRSAPAFATTAIAALALGVGANTAIFSVVNSVLLKPLPFPGAERIVQLMNSTPQGNFPGASVPKYNAWRTQTTALEDVAAYDVGGPGINVGGGDRPEQAKGIHVSQEFFRLFGVPVIIGRAFSSEEDRPNGGKVVLISDGLWHRRYGSDPNVIGKSIALGGEQYSIIGIVGPTFDFNPTPDLFLPFQADPNSTQQAHFFSAAARLKPGVTLEQARAALALTANEFRVKFPAQLGPKNSFSADLMQETIVRDVRPALLILLGAVGFVLLIACANVANLLVARASVRSREIAIRSAIGAGRWRIIRQLLTESLLLSTAGGIGGLIIGVIGVRALLALNPGNLPRIGEDGSGVTIDWTVLAFTMGVSLLTGILFGVFPALQASRADLNATIKDTGGRAGSSLGQNKARSVLVVVELALAIVLLAGAGLLIRTFAALHVVDPGFDPHNVLTLETSLTGVKFDAAAGVTDLARRAIERIEALPGVQSAAASSYLPLEGGLGLPFNIIGRQRAEGPSDGGAGWAYVTAHFFDVFKVKVVQGRTFTDRDAAGSPGVVIVNEAFVRRFWQKESPVGHQLVIGPGMGPAFAEPAREIVGVVADARDGGLNNDPQPQMFVPVAQVKDAVLALNNRFMPLAWVIRTNLNPLASSQQVQQVFKDLADLPIARARSMDQVVVQSTARNRFNTLLLGIFAFVAILLAAIGLYGLMAYSVEQRTMEFGIRMALGANGGSLRNMVLGQAMKLAVVGTLLGSIAAYFLKTVLSTMLFGVSAKDPLVFSGAALLLMGVMFMASYLPARRAIGIDPVIALRHQ
jgi:putative ABC transport system permease protein